MYQNLFAQNSFTSCHIPLLVMYTHAPWYSKMQLQFPLSFKSPGLMLQQWHHNRIFHICVGSPLEQLWGVKSTELWLGRQHWKFCTYIK